MTTLVDHFDSSPREREKTDRRGRKELEEIVEEMKESKREESGTGMKGTK